MLALSMGAFMTNFLFAKVCSIRAFSFFLIVIGVSVVTSAQDRGLPVKHNPESEYEIRYDDLNLILSSSVLDTGPSDRRPASRALNKGTQSRIKHGNTSATGFEGNRIIFDAYTSDHVESLLAIRKDLEAVNDFTPLEEFNEWEQLAYWYNLHNVAVMYEVAKAYPIKKLKSLMSGKKNVWDSKTMSIGGRPTSIRDIEEHVIERWDNPLVLYGFFMGTIGGPDIRPEAYTGENVVEALQHNAVRFINSLRGFRLWSREGRVSEHYELGRRFFPDFQNDVTQHLATFARQDTRADLAKAKRIKVKNYDWGIADLKNGSTYAGGSFNTNPRALAFFIETPPAGAASPLGGTPSATVDIDTLGSSALVVNSSSSSLAPQTKALLRAMKIRNQRRARHGEVTVEEFVADDGGRVRTRLKKAPEEKPEEDNEGSPVVAE